MIVPLPIKLLFTLFCAVLIPVYLTHYGATNFLYFCDEAVLLTLFGIWLESALLVSMAAVGILVPQVVWVVDFLATALGHPLLGMTRYMFDAQKPLYLRALSSFHGWLPFLLLYLVHRLRYDARALPLLERPRRGHDRHLLPVDAAAASRRGPDTGQHRLCLGHERQPGAESHVGGCLARGFMPGFVPARLPADARRAVAVVRAQAGSPSPADQSAFASLLNASKRPSEIAARMSRIRSW